MLSNATGVTILPDTNSHFNGKNYALWKLQLTELLKGKGLWGYIEGLIPCPATPTTSMSGPTTVPLPPDPIPIYSLNPSQDEWNFHDQLAHSHIILNALDPISLGVRTDGTAKECWDSITAEHAKKTDMALSKAESALNALKFDGNSVIDAHVSELHTQRQAVNDLSTTAMSDQVFHGIIIRSILPTDNWMPILPSLYSLPTLMDIISHLQTHAATLRATGKGPTQSQALTAGSHTPTHGCGNPGCKAHDKTKHTMDNCYWPGGGKEGQFPPNFSRQRQANHANAMADNVRHFVLAACATPSIESDHDKSRVIIEDGDTRECVFEWNGTWSFWRWNEAEDSDTELFMMVESGYTSEFESVGMPDMEFSDLGDITDDEMPSLQDVDANSDEEEETEQPDVCMESNIIVEEIFLDVEPADRAFVTTMFEGQNLSVMLTFMDSGASDFFFKNEEDFTDYMPCAFHMGTSAVETTGQFDILGKGTATNMFVSDGKAVKLTFKNALHSPSLAANLISISALDKAGLSTVFTDGKAVVKDKSGHELFVGCGSEGMYVLESAPSPQALSS